MKAEKLYSQIHSHYGRALTNYSLGIIMQSNYSSLLKE